MAKMHRMSLMAMALIMGGGVLPLAGAQQTVGAPPTYAKGPWFFAQLAPGNYTVEASTPDQAQQPQRQKVHIEGSCQSRVDFRWR